MPTFYEFFAGAGLVREALAPQWKCVWANDNSEKKREVYAANFSSDELSPDDIALVSANSLPRNVDMAWASFPCQDLSLAGWRGGMSAARSGTFWAFWRIMRDLMDLDDRPPLIVVENVMGLLHGENFTTLCEAFASLGMQFGALVIDAKYFVPQSRPRVFLVAVDENVDCSALTSVEPTKDQWTNERMIQAVRSLPDRISTRWHWWRLPVPKDPVKKVESLIEREPNGVKWHSPSETKRLIDLMSEANRTKLDRALRVGKFNVGFLYKRMRHGAQRAEVRFDGIAGCLRTPRGGSSRQTVIVVEKGQVRSRLLSPREAARLMGVRDTFELPSNYNHAYFSMGDAVVVPLVRWLSENLLLQISELCIATDKSVSLRAHDNRHLTVSRRAVEAMAASWKRFDS